MHAGPEHPARLLRVRLSAVDATFDDQILDDVDVMARRPGRRRADLCGVSGEAIAALSPIGGRSDDRVYVEVEFPFGFPASSVEVVEWLV